MVMKYTPEEYVRRLKRLEKEISQQTDRAVVKVAQWTAVKAAQRAPKDTGALVNNIHWGRTKENKKSQGLIYQLNPAFQNPSWSGKHYNYAEAMMPNLRGRQTKFNEWLNRAVRRNGADPDYMRSAALGAKIMFRKDITTAIELAIKTSK